MNGNNPQTPHDPLGKQDPDSLLHDFMDKRNDSIYGEGPGILVARGQTYGCEDCGCVVVDRTFHDQFHQRLELLQTLAMEAHDRIANG